MTTPNEPWPIPEAAICAACEAFFTRVYPNAGTDQRSQSDYMRVAILAAIPHLGLAELLREAAAAAQDAGDMCYDDRSDEAGQKMYFPLVIVSAKPPPA